jgi:hypothetical protein
MIQRPLSPGRLLPFWRLDRIGPLRRCHVLEVAASSALVELGALDPSIEDALVHAVLDEGGEAMDVHSDLESTQQLTLLSTARVDGIQRLV